MKQVWVNAATCSCTRATTEGAALPTVVTAMPDPRSIRVLPSTSRSTPPPAASTNTGRVVPTPSATYCFLRASFSCDRGPGISVTRWRCWVRGVPAAIVVLMTAAYGRRDCGFHRSQHRRPRIPSACAAVWALCQTRAMALARFKDLCIDVADARASGDYWSTMRGWRLELHDDGDAHLRDDAGRIQVWLNVVPEPKSVKNRVHIDVNAESVQRAIDAGARVDSEFPRWTTLLDPDGQEHCVFPRAEPFAKRAYELGWDCAEGAEACRTLAAWWCEVLGGAVIDDDGYSWVQDIPEC